MSRIEAFQIEALTPEQVAQVPAYRDKWQRIACSTQRVDPERAIATIHAAYQTLEYRPPKIKFFSSPAAALQQGSSRRAGDFLDEIFDTEFAWTDLLQTTLEFNQAFSDDFEFLSEQLHDHLVGTLWVNYLDRLSHRYFEQATSRQSDDYPFVSNFLSSRRCPEYWAPHASLVDFCVSVLHLPVDPQRWQIFQALIQDCGWVLPMEKECWVCDRPSHLQFDDQHRLHAEGEPAIQFTDGYSLYAHHGVILPEKYGRPHPHQWQPQWILAEQNAELRRVLIQGIGYARICQELQAIELDSWREYTLLKMNVDIDLEPVHLLKMTCPSTSYIHVTRVPPQFTSARESIRWVNWDVDPEEFSVQT